MVGQTIAFRGQRQLSDVLRNVAVVRRVRQTANCSRSPSRTGGVASVRRRNRSQLDRDSFYFRILMKPILTISGPSRTA